jgi:hypothetical protein
VPEKAIISHRGEKYEIGRGKRFYGIWVVGAPYDAPVDRWPENPAGWQQAWTRFTGLEKPDTIQPVARERRGLRSSSARPAFEASQPDAPAFGGPVGAPGDTSGPVPSGPAFGAVPNSAPAYGAPAYGAPAYGAPAYGAPAYGAPAYGAPAYGAAPQGAAQAAAAPNVTVPSGDAALGGNPAEDVLAFGPVAPPRTRKGSLLLAGEALLVLGVVLGIAGIFPAYEGGQSLLSQSDQVVAHLFDLIGWAVTAGLVALSVARPSNAARLGALFGLGLSAVTFGMFVADWGQVTVTGVSLGTGLIVSTLGWLACTAGAGLVLGTRTGTSAPSDLPSRPVRLGPGQAGPVALLVLAAVGTAAAFAPSWDSYALVAKATGASQTITAGNAFDNPGLTIAGNVLVMVAVVAVAAVAALWRPSRHGALLLAGAIVPLIAQVVSAMIQTGEPVSSAMFGISSADASALELTITTGLTGIFWVYLVFVISLLVSCVWLFTEPGRPLMPGIGVPPWQPVGGVPGTSAGFAAPVSQGAVFPGTVSQDTVSQDTVPQDAVPQVADTDKGTDTDSSDSDAETADSDAGTADGGQSAYA